MNFMYRRYQPSMQSSPANTQNTGVPHESQNNRHPEPQQKKQQTARTSMQNNRSSITNQSNNGSQPSSSSQMNGVRNSGSAPANAAIPNNPRQNGMRNNPPRENSLQQNHGQGGNSFGGNQPQRNNPFNLRGSGRQQPTNTNQPYKNASTANSGQQNNGGQKQQNQPNNHSYGNNQPSADIHMHNHNGSGQPRGQNTRPQHSQNGWQFPFFLSPPKQPHTNQPPPSPKGEKHKNFLFDLLPPALYNSETKKILGIINAEDLLLVALIFMFLDNDENDNQLIVYALIYILLSDYIDLPI